MGECYYCCRRSQNTPENGYNAQGVNLIYLFIFKFFISYNSHHTSFGAAYVLGGEGLVFITNSQTPVSRPRLLGDPVIMMISDHEVAVSRAAC